MTNVAIYENGGINRLTARSPKNNLAYLIKVKPDEQEVDSPYPNTLRAILECFRRLAEYEDTNTAPEDISKMIAAIVRLNENEKAAIQTLRKIDWVGSGAKALIEEAINALLRDGSEGGEKQ